MFSIKGYDQWKTASPYDDEDEPHCANCGQAAEDHVASDEFAETATRRVRSLQTKWKEQLNQLNKNIPLDAALEELARVLTWAVNPRIVCEGFVERDDKGDPYDS